MSAPMPVDPPSDKVETSAGKRRLSRAPDESWLEKNIESMYREVVEEPVPEELLLILDRVLKFDG